MVRADLLAVFGGRILGAGQVVLVCGVLSCVWVPHARQAVQVCGMLLIFWGAPGYLVLGRWCRQVRTSSVDPLTLFGGRHLVWNTTV